MKRALCLVTAAVLLAPPALRADDAATTTPGRTNGGQVSVGVLGAEDPSSSKFSEYRDIPENVSVPGFSLWSRGPDFDFTLRGYNVRQDDQRYNGLLETKSFDVTFDYNQVPHRMGFGGRSILNEVSPGVWGLSSTLSRGLGTAVDTTATTARTVSFYDSLLSPTFSSAGSLDVASTRKRGSISVDLGKKLPFDLVLSYTRELRSGYRGEGGGGLYSAINSVVEVPEPLNDVTQDLALRATWEWKSGNVHGALSRNLYNNRAETLVVANPFQWFDTPYVSTPAPAVGGGSSARWILAPDNEATTGSLGLLYKAPRHTRLAADVALARWTQNAPFYPYTINSAILTPSGLRADSLGALPQPSLDGRIDTTTVNLTASSKPVKNLSLRASFRLYDLTNKTNRFVITGDVAASPERSWTTVTPTAADPYGHATANVYDTKTRRFTAAASYDVKALTVEAQVHASKLERTSREATSGDDNGFGLSALYHAKDWLGFRGTYQQSHRTAEGETYYGFQSDEAERKTRRTSLDVELSPLDSLELTFAYARRDVDYPGRPDRIPMSSGLPLAGAQPIPGTPSGLLEAKYDSFTTEVAYLPSPRAELSAYYTYEKDRTVNQWATTTGTALNNLLNYAGRDKTDTYGVAASFQIKPEVWTLTANAMRQKTDGLMDITAREAGTFYTPGRTTLIPAGQGGAADIDAWDDATRTMVSAQLDYAVAKAWTLTAGYMYEKYDFRDAYTSGDLLMPQSVLLFLDSDNGAYDASLFYTSVKYSF